MFKFYERVEYGFSDKICESSQKKFLILTINKYFAYNILLYISMFYGNWLIFIPVPLSTQKTPSSTWTLYRTDTLLAAATQLNNIPPLTRNNTKIHASRLAAHIATKNALFPIFGNLNGTLLFHICSLKIRFSLSVIEYPRINCLWTNWKKI